MKKTIKRINSILIIISLVASLMPYRAVSAAEIAEITPSPFVEDTPSPTPEATDQTTEMFFATPKYLKMQNAFPKILGLVFYGK